MDPGWPEATAVAVQGGRVLSVGRTMDDLAPWLDAAKKAGTAVTIDATFKDHVLLPGFVEAHGHPLIGAVALTRPCLSRFPQPNPYGRGFPGVKDIDACAKAIADHLAANPTTAGSSSSGDTTSPPWVSTSTLRGSIGCLVDARFAFGTRVSTSSTRRPPR
jgi:predicted amidohydrolase YtcJ